MILAPKSPQYRSSGSLAPFPRGGQAGVGPALAVGGAISRLGDIIATRAQELKQERDAAVVGDLYNQWRDEDRKQVTELFKRKGKDAVNLDLEYDKWFNKSRSESDKQTENGSQQVLLGKYLDRERAQNLDNLAVYQANEGQRYKAQSQEAMFKNAVEDSRSDGFKTGAVMERIDRLNNFVDINNPGMNEETRRALKEQYTSAILFANMQERINISPDAALQTLEEWKEPLGDGYYNLNAAIVAKKKSDKVEARVAANEAKTAAKEAEAEAHDAEELNLSKVLYFEKDPVKAAQILAKSAYIKADEIPTWAERIEKFSKGEKSEDPFKTSDPKYTDKLFEEAAAGLVDPATIRPLPNKLSREDFRLAKGLAEYAIKGDKKYIMDMTESVISEGSKLILGTDYLYIEKPEKAINDQGTMERFIYSELLNAETDADKIDLLDENSKNFVLRRALQNVGRNYDKEKERQPGFSPMFFESGGQKKQEGQEGITDLKQLWGEGN